MRSHLASILKRGRRHGMRADVFAKVGDSISQSPAFMEQIGCGHYRLSGQPSLRDVIHYFARRPLSGQSSDCGRVNSFSRDSAATQAFAASSWPLTPGASRSAQCLAAESPLGCELRLVRPAWALVLFGTNDVTIGIDIAHVDPLPGFLEQIDRIVAATSREGVVPILTTLPPRSGALEEAATERLNRGLYRLARRRRAPLINLWRGLRTLPNQGLSADGLHPSLYGGPQCVGLCDPAKCAPACQSANFSPAGLQFGHDLRNLVSLRMLARAAAFERVTMKAGRGRRPSAVTAG
jgi:lysophospholipase L1-like esterase